LIKTFIPLPFEASSDDRIVFSAIDLKKFELCFINWASALTESFKSEVSILEST
jgi:hypothetical protein